MKILHIYRTPPDSTVKSLARAWNEGREAAEVHLYLTPVDYGRLIDLIFESDKVLTWF
ncbi:MAG: hypothetical protein SV487_01415 [Thermodesulfobacteriota bacterium]|nr:hypothetical protein [Thermodesulfobacteriota bacterium]